MSRVSESALDRFGEFLMHYVRDEAIKQWRATANGEVHTFESAKAKLALLDNESKQVFVSLVPYVVDTVLHHLLWGLEEVEDVRLSVTTGEGEVPNLKEVSDGLAGELYSEEGWIARFSRQPR